MTDAAQGSGAALRGKRVAVALRDPGPVVPALWTAGVEVTCFVDPVRALLGALDGQFDAVIASLHRRALDGEVLTRVLRERATERLAILLVADAREGAAALMRGLEAGADDCLCAPIAPELLRAKLRVALRAPLATPWPFGEALAADPEVPGRLAGYRLEGVLGSGTYGKVYAARREADGRPVALKLVASDVLEDRALLVRFLREIAALRQVRSRHVVRIHEAGYQQGRFFLVMDRVEGTPADRLLEVRGRFDPLAVVRIGIDLCTALEAVAAAGLVHRDLKPGNVLVDEHGHATLVDFGLAKPTRPSVEVTHGKELVGTIPYFSPELVRGQPPDPGSDVYSLGVTLWELLIDQQPFEAETELGLLEKIAGGPRAPAVAELRPDAPPELSWLVARLMEPDPDARLRDLAAARRTLLALAPAAAPAAA